MKRFIIEVFDRVGVRVDHAFQHAKNDREAYLLVKDYLKEHVTWASKQIG